MKLTAELSLYPLNEQYIPVIDDFLHDLRKRAELTIITNAMSTQICGDYDAVFTAVHEVLRDSCERHGKQVLVCKFIPGQALLAAT
ncbi:MAG: YkoF family thiamine/hydroxymethylpyrimidine-binding protein [Gammaproteobacteria bacterium]